MVRAWYFEQLLEVVRGTLGGLSTPLMVGDGHERTLMPLLVLFHAGMVGGAFAGVLVPLCLALEAVEDRFDRLLAEAWLVVMSRSSLVVYGPLSPNL